MKIKLSKSQWEGIGKKAGWMKKSQVQPQAQQTQQIDIQIANFEVVDMDCQFDEDQFTGIELNYKVDGTINGQPFSISSPAYYHEGDGDYITSLIEYGPDDMDKNILRLMWDKVDEQYHTKIREWFKEIDRYVYNCSHNTHL